MAGPIQLLRSNQQAVATLRRDSRDAADTNVGGYVLPSGDPIAVPGDENAPYAKTPPFPSQFSELGAPFAAIENPIPTTHNTLTSLLPILPVEWFRTLSLSLEYIPGGDGSVLSLIAYSVQMGQRSDFSDALFFPTGFISPTPIALAYEQTRAWGPQRLIISAGAEPGTIRLVQPFDVAPYTFWTFTVAEELEEGSTGGALRLWANANV